MPSEIPYFKYHLDPLKTGHAKRVDFNCVCCNRPSAYAYHGSRYTSRDQEGPLCFKCIKSGAAAEKFDLNFNWFNGEANNIHPTEIEELEKKTPGYSGWQQPIWLTHCNQIAQFQGNFTVDEMLERFDELKFEMKKNFGRMDDEVLLDIIQCPDRIRVDNLAFFKFQCLACNKILVHVDYT